MPLASEDRYFGGGKGAASKAYMAMVKQYGLAKGQQVYYAVMNRNKAKMRRGSRSGK